MTYSTKINQLVMSLSLGLALITGFTTEVHADAYPQVYFDTGRGTTVQVTSKELVSQNGVSQTCTEKASLDYFQPKTDAQVLSPSSITLVAECYHPPGFAMWGANINFNIISQNSVVGSCTVGAFFNDTKQSNGPINFTDKTNMGVVQPTQCSNGFHIKTVMTSDGSMGVEIIQAGEFQVYDGAGFGLYACTYHQGDKNTYCSKTFASLWTSITIDGSMQPQGGLKGGDMVCLAEDTGRQIYSNYYFTLNWGSSNFMIDGYPMEAYGTAFNPEYYIYKQYQNAITALTPNGQPSEVSTSPCIKLDKDHPIVWVP